MFGEGSMWMRTRSAHSVSRIDPKTNAVVQTIQVGSGPAGVAVGGRFVWVANALGASVSQIDPRTNSVAKTLRRLGRPSGIAFGQGGVRVADASDLTVRRIDPETDRIGKAIQVEGARMRSRWASALSGWPASRLES